MSSYMAFYLRAKDNTSDFLEMEWFCRSAWVYQALAQEVKYESYCEFDEKIAAKAMGWLGERIEAAEEDIAATKELIEVVKEIPASIAEVVVEIRNYQEDIKETRATIEGLRAAKDVIARYAAIANYSTNARVYVAHEFDPNNIEE